MPFEAWWSLRDETAPVQAGYREIAGAVRHHAPMLKEGNWVRNVRLGFKLRPVAKAHIMAIISAVPHSNKGPVHILGIIWYAS